MPIGTFDPIPQPFFRQGVSARSKLILCSALALFLMAADNRLALTQPLRNAMATALMPVEHLLLVPVRIWEQTGDYLGGLGSALTQNRSLQAQLAAQAEKAARARQLSEENQRLRALLNLQPPVGVRSQAAEVLYEAPDPYSRKLFIDRGSQQGIVAGSPVINENGVLGQITRTYLLTSELTLLIDKDAAIPVLNARTQHRSAAFGDGQAMELRFMAGNDDVQPGDMLLTSGVDGIYPGGLEVAQVSQVDRRGDAGFARIALTPRAPPDGVRHVLVLEPLNLQLPARPEPPPVETPAQRARKGAKR